LDAAADLIVKGRLDDYTAFAGTRAVAKKAGVFPGSVSYHFAGDQRGRSSRVLAEEAMRRALTRGGMRVTDRTIATLLAAADQLRAGDEEGLLRIARAAADDIIGYSSQESLDDDTAGWLAMAAAPNDETAQEFLRERYQELLERYEPVYHTLAEATGRRFTRHISARELAISLTALADGFLARRRFAPDEAEPELFARLAIALFQAATVSRIAADDPDIGDELVPTPPGATLDRGKRNTIAWAAKEIYEASGRWDDVTIAAVAGRAGVNRATVTANFGSRNGLAAAIWAPWVPKLREQLERDASRDPFDVALHAHLLRVAELAADHREVTGALLEAVFAATLEHGPPNYKDPTDPRTLVRLPPITTQYILANKQKLRDGLVRDEEGAAALSAFLHNTILNMAMTRSRSGGTRPTAMTASEVARYVTDIVFDGMLVRRGRRGRKAVG
jgi:AcrR family transcriptional regulator